MARPTNVTCKMSSRDACRTTGPSMVVWSSCVVLLNTSVIMITLKAFLFMLFQFSALRPPSPGPGCFSTRRTRMPQYDKMAKKTRDLDMNKHASSDMERAKTGNMKSSRISSQSTTQQSNL